VKSKQDFEISEIKVIAREFWPEADKRSMDLFTLDMEHVYGTPLFAAIELGTSAWARFGDLGKSTEFSLRVAREFPEYDTDGPVGDHRC